MGYAGGTTADPTYDDIGDHTETLQVDYDPEVISYGRLLGFFWESHDPSAVPWSRQYRAVIFTMDGEQEKLALKSLRAREASLGKKVSTAIEPLRTFHLAEGYHQKYYLRQDPVIMADFLKAYPDLEGFVNSQAAAKTNGFLSGMGSGQDLARILSGLGLSEESARRLSRRVR